jgi:hypothetical protein
VSFSLLMILRSCCNASSALPPCTGSRDPLHRLQYDCRGVAPVRASSIGVMMIDTLWTFGHYGTGLSDKLPQS